METNYSRQVLIQLHDERFCPDAVGEPFSTVSKTILSLLPDAAKFFLPHGGRVIQDREFRALSDDVPLRLPYPVIALEYSRSPADQEADDPEVAFFSPKTVVLARETSIPATGEAAIGLIPVGYVPNGAGSRVGINLGGDIWAPIPEAYLPIEGWRGDPENCEIQLVVPYADVCPPRDYGDEVHAILNLLGALACTNIEVERQPARKARKKGAFASFPFDDYHFLVVRGGAGSVQDGEGQSLDGSGRSPREHLRRGHIRRLASGKTVWVNAAIVNPGHKGKLSKSYVVG